MSNLELGIIILNYYTSKMISNILQRVIIIGNFNSEAMFNYLILLFRPSLYLHRANGMLNIFII